MVDITDLASMSDEDLEAERDRLLAQLGATQRDGNADFGAFTPEPTVRDGQDADEFPKSDIVASIKLEAKDIPTHDADGFPLSLEAKWALLNRRSQ